MPGSLETVARTGICQSATLSGRDSSTNGGISYAAPDVSSLWKTRCGCAPRSNRDLLPSSNYHVMHFPQIPNGAALSEDSQKTNTFVWLQSWQTFSRFIYISFSFCQIYTINITRTPFNTWWDFPPLENKFSCFRLTALWKQVQTFYFVGAEYSNAYTRETNNLQMRMRNRQGFSRSQTEIRRVSH